MQPKIYLIDDDLITLKLLEAVLKGKDYNVRTFLGGMAALKLFQSEPVDLVITDIFLPDFDGHALTSALKQVCNKVKIIAMSATPNTKNFKVLELAKQVGADMVFTKPIDCNELDQAIKKLLQLT